MIVFKKHFIAVVSAVLFVLCLFTACNKTEKAKQEENTVKESTKVVTVTSSFLKDMVYQLAGDFCTIELIIPEGTDPHVYVAQPADLKKLENADLVLYQGLLFEGKMQDVLEKTGLAVTRVLDEDMLIHNDEEHEHDEEHECECGEEHGHGEHGHDEHHHGHVHGEIDPHFWFDIGLYKEVVKGVSEDLIKLMPEHAEAIKTREVAYQGELDELHTRCIEAINNIPKERRFLVTPHDAFSYFGRSYDIEAVAPLGISTDSEVGAKDIEDTVNFIVDNKIPAIFVESTTNPDRMAKLQEAAKAKGWEVKVVGGEGQELYTGSLAPKGQDADTYVKMYWHNVKLITDNLK